MKGKKEAPSPSPPFCPRLLNQSRLTFPPLCLSERGLSLPPSPVTSLTELTETRYRNSTERLIRLKGIRSFYFYRLNARYEFSAFTSLPKSRSKKPKALLAYFPSKLDLSLSFLEKTDIRLKRSPLESFVYFGDQPQLFVDTIIKEADR